MTIYYTKFNNTEQHDLLNQCVKTLDFEDKQFLEALSDSVKITALVDGLGLACPLPLLKTKVALRSMAVGESVYVLATDPNSQHDLSSFCRQSGLNIVLATQSNITPNNTCNNKLEKLDTIFHVIITKTNGN